MSFSINRWLWLVLLAVPLIAVGVWLILRWRKPEAGTRATNPNPTYITNEMWWLWEQLLALEPSTKLGGIYANKAGYHNIRRNLPSYDYSVCDDPPDQGGPSDKAAAIDWTFPNAQAGNYSTIAKYTKRLLASAQDPDDPRLNGWREFYGNADDDAYVEGWDCRYGVAATSDSSHLWHIHISENRDQTTSMVNKEALVSVLKGETVDQWLGESAITEGGAVLLNCPTKPERLDLLYVGPNGQVWHRWYATGGMNAMWSGNGKGENLGGAIVVGTLTAAWLPDGSAINISGLGAPDVGVAAPQGCGQFWGYTLGYSGSRSGWGSLPGVFGAYPSMTSAPPALMSATSTGRHGRSESSADPSTTTQ